MQQVSILGDIALDKPLKVSVDGTDVILARNGDTVRAFSAKCPHAGAPLEEGVICAGRIVCPWHKAMFAVGDGALLEPPALDALQQYPVLVEGERVLVSAEPIPPALRTARIDARTFLIVGAGAAGTAAAAALREFGFDGRIVLLGAEPDAPYDRTALSKFVLEGGMKPADVAPLRDPGFYEQHRIERRHGTATGLDPAARRLTLADGTALDYDAVLLAPGGTPRTLDVPGADLPGVHVLRSLEDARRILPWIRNGARAVIVGGGFIGLEAASALTKYGLQVTVVSPDPLPLEKPFGREVAQALRRLHETNGVIFVSGRVARINGISHAAGVTLDDGRTLAAEVVTVGLGVRPATDFAASLPLDEDGGISVDAGMRAADAVFAAGDVARFPFGDTPIRVEHWRVAQQTARIAARSMLGGDAAWTQPPFFWTYHFGRRIELLGHPQEVDHTIVEGDLDSMDFIVRQMHGGRMVGAIACQREAEMAVIAATLGAAA
jgi:NADPH-dependent 2,4-dienoyl-CoA reductase/sulfur reductase-like enzyme/nitrite reductase/ring-hydroxylating ferredoxin subunit